VFSDAVDPQTICREAIDYWSKTLDTFLEGRDRLPENRICDVNYVEILRDTLAVVRRIYEYFGWSLSTKVEELMRQALASQPRDRYRLHRYDLSQFGVQEGESAPRFAAYCDRFRLAVRRKRTSTAPAEKLATG
jgi:hypothetical protein